MIKTIECPSCNATVPGEDLNLERLVGKCNNCDSVFRFADQIDFGDMPEQARASAQASKMDAPRPADFMVMNNGGELFIQWRWFNASIIFFTIFALFWNGFLVIWFSIAFASGALEMAAFGSIHLLVGLFLAYYTVAGYINRTTVRVNPREISVQNGPLPWFGNRRLDAMSITQLYCKQRVHRGSKGRISYSYPVYAIMQDGTDHEAVTGVTDYTDSLYLEQEIERFLRIKDRPVKGEHRG